MTSTIIRAAGLPKISRHVGSVGDRVRVDGVIRKMIGYSGKSIIHVIEDADGNQFVVRRSALGSKPGVLVTLEAEILEHRTYQDTKQTILSTGKQLVVSGDHPMLRL